MKKPPPHPEPGESLPSTTFEDVLDCCGSDPRLEILLCLSPRPLQVGEITGVLQYGQPHVSNHLRILRGAGLVQSAPERKNRVYSLTERATIAGTAVSLNVRLSASDGSAVHLQLTDKSRLIRCMPPGLRRLLWSETSVIIAPRAGEALLRRDGGEIRNRPPNAP